MTAKLERAGAFFNRTTRMENELNGSSNGNKMRATSFHIQKIVDIQAIKLARLGYCSS